MCGFVIPSSVLLSSGRFRFLAHAGSLRVSVARRLRPATARVDRCRFSKCARARVSVDTLGTWISCLLVLATRLGSQQKALSVSPLRRVVACVWVRPTPRLVASQDTSEERSFVVFQPLTQRLLRATWLILPVVICLSQRLSHACLSISDYTVKLRMAH